MGLREQLDSGLKDAMRARDQMRMDTIRSVKSALLYKDVEAAGKPLDDAGVAKVIQSLAKQRRDSIEQFKAGGRQDLVEKEERELAVLQTFLPQPLSAEELETLVAEALKETGATDLKSMGSVVKAVQAKAAGRADGKTVADLVKKKLSGG
jgi:uncharacterized protein YqeY